MFKNITACVLGALCILAFSASAGAQGIVDGIAGAAEDIVDGAAGVAEDIANGVGDAAGDIADGLTGGSDDRYGMTGTDHGMTDHGMTDYDESNSSFGSDYNDSENFYGYDKTEYYDGDYLISSDDDDDDYDDDDDEDDTDSSDDSLSGAYMEGAAGGNPDTGISFGYIAGMAVLGALGVAVTANKRRG
ncbi:MAG: hypothetical protein J1F04_01240 [Oscillospiraceae bacterium]|nr:hypothetical protein [Oscillospiraceae bacterium]